MYNVPYVSYMVTDPMAVQGQPGQQSGNDHFGGILQVV